MPRSGFSGAPSQSATGGYTNVWGNQGGGVWSPPSSGGSDSGPSQIGTGSLNVTSPSGFVTSAEETVKNSQDFFHFLGQGLFGASDEKPGGSLAGEVPVLGWLGRRLFQNPVADVIGAGAGAIGGAVDATGGFLETVTLGNKDLTSDFEALPETAYKEQARREIAADPSRGQHLMYEALKAQAEQDQLENPDLFYDLQTPTGSWADSIGKVFGIVTSPVRVVERGFAGLTRATGMTRLQEIEAISQGGVPTGTLGTGMFAGGAELSPVEQIALQQWKSGTWSADQANDFLASHGAGFSHDPGLQLAGSVALDPTVWGSLGASGLAKLGATGVRLNNAAKLAEAAGTAAPTLRAAGTSGRTAFLGKLAENPRVNAIVRSYGARVYEPLEGSAVGTAARAARTIIDPFYALGQKRAVGEAMVDVAAEGTTRAVHASYGVGNAYSALRYAQGVSPQTFDRIATGIGTYAGNLGRKVLLREHQQNILALEGGEALLSHVPAEIMDDLGKTAPKNFPDLVKEEGIAVGVGIWDEPAQANLAKRMANLYGEKSIEEYAADIAKMNDSERGFLHAATYGSVTDEWLGVWGRGAHVYTGNLPWNRFVLANRTSLTNLGAQGVLERLNDLPALKATLKKGAKIEDAQADIIREAQALYPELRYVSLRKGPQRARSIEQFITKLTEDLDLGRFMAQVTDSELAGMPDEVQQFVEKYGDMWTIGFRPDDDMLYAMTRDLEGRLIAMADPWVDHVGQAAPAARPASALLYNVAGMPILGKAVGPAAKALDYVEVAARTIKQGVTSAMITENARSRFVRLAVQGKQSKFGGLKIGGGLTEAEAHELFTRVIEVAQLNKSTARALQPQNLWERTADLVPPRLYDTGAMTARDLRNLVLDAYEGDLRFVGLTQKFTGRLKTVLGPLGPGGGNMIGQVAEGLYPTIKFRLGALFQVQEKLEGFVLNSQRGIRGALGVKLTEADRVAANILDRMAETGVARIADIDMVEYSKLSLLGRDIEHGLSGLADPSVWESITSVQGTKRLNMLRTFQDFIGKPVKEAMERNQPGLWKEIADNYQASASHVLSDNEVALRYVAENVLSNDVHVNSIIKPGARAADFDIATAADMWSPSNLGELKPLMLDRLAKRLAIPVADGKTLNSVKELRVALADGRIDIERIQDAMLSHGMHADYVKRVTNALDFHWDPFWRTVKSKFNLTTAESESLQSMMAGAAKVRGMTPVDFMSQVFSPTIERGTAGAVDSLASAVNVLRVPKTGGSVEDLTAQLADVFQHHLDPSGREALLAAFDKGAQVDINALMKAGKTAESQALQKTVEALRGGWGSPTSKEFAKRVLNLAAGGAERDPDVIRAAQQFSKWSKTALQEGLLKDSPQMADLLKRITGIPTEAAAPFNKTQQLMYNQIASRLAKAESDAFRLQYFARNRSFLQRSVNHPFFGIYPASYMWGKIMPELVRFIAKEPFGIQTGALAYALADVEKSLAIQREFDPEFEAWMDKVGRNQAIWLMGYMLPSLPWDVGAAWPNWARDIAQQAEANQQRIDAGGEPKEIDLGRTLQKVSDYLSPVRPFQQLERGLSGVDELGELLSPQNAPMQGASGILPTPISGPVKGTGLGAVLTPEVAELQALLTGK